MPGRHRGVTRISRGPTRKSVWFGFQPLEVTIAAASTAVLSFSLNVAALALRPFTIVRTRGEIFYRSDQVASSENYGGNFGIAVVFDQAAAIGVTAIPTPVTDIGSDLFFVYEQMYGQLDSADAIGRLEIGHIHTFDSKAMRKVNQSEDVVVVQETPSFINSFFQVQSFRMLVKLH